MNTSENTPDDTPINARPLGYWLRTVDGLISQEFHTAFEGSGSNRREWMLLNALSGDVTLPGFAERLARKGKHLRGLEERGWVTESGDGTWTLTDEGRAAKERLGAVVDSIRSRVAASVSPEDFATTMASLEAIAREFGWDESTRPPRGRGFGRRFGRGFGGFGGPGFGPRAFGRDLPDGPNLHHGFRPGHGPGDTEDGTDHGHEHGYGHGYGHAPECGGRRGRGEHPHGAHRHDQHRHDQHRHDQHRGTDRSGRSAEQAYERGFTAGFERGQSGSTGSADAA